MWTPGSRRCSPPTRRDPGLALTGVYGRRSASSWWLGTSGASDRGRSRSTLRRKLIASSVSWRTSVNKIIPMEASDAQKRVVELEEIPDVPGTYFNPQTEVVVVVDDSASIDQEVFNMEPFEGANWVRISD